MHRIVSGAGRMIDDRQALALCKRHGAGLDRAGVLETLDGGWLVIGLGYLPDHANNQLGKFDPTQLRISAGSGPGSGEWTRDPNIVDARARSKPKKPEQKSVDFAHFFATFDPMIAPMAQRLDMDRDLLLAIIAHEDTWGTDEHNDKLHNIFGVTNAGGPNLGYSSYQEACDYWSRKFGYRMKGVYNVDVFIEKMKEAKYNSRDPNYYVELKDAYISVVNHRKKLGL